jgi:hypothetical protein
MNAPVNPQTPWMRQIAAARHLLVVEFWSGLTLVLVPLGLLLVWFAAPVRQPARLDGIPWPPTDDWLQIFLMPLIGLAILIALGVWGLLTSLPFGSPRWFWALVGALAWLSAGYCFPSVGQLPPFLSGFSERRGPLVLYFWLMGQGAFHLAWPRPRVHSPGLENRLPTAFILAMTCWTCGVGFWALGYWLKVDPALDQAIFPFTQLVLLCLLAALAEALGLLWRYRRLRAWAGYNLMREAEPG